MTNEKDPDNPRDPDPEFVQSSNSSHLAHANLRKIYVLLSIDTMNGKAYFVVEGLNQWPTTYEELQSNTRYFYEEHTCPTNYIRIPMICFNKDVDPHGLFKFEEAVWMVEGKHDEDYFCEIFPQLGVFEARDRDQNKQQSKGKNYD